MDLQADPKAVRYCLTVSRHSGTAVIAIGVLVLAGWLLDFKQFTTFWWGFATMKPNTALCLVLLGISLRLAQTSVIRPPIANRSRRLFGEIVAGSAALVGLLTGAEYVLRRDLGIDELLIHGSVFSTAGTHPARMSTTSVVAVVAFGLSILCLDSKSTWAARLSQPLALLGATLGLLGVVGYIYHAEALYAVSTDSAVAPHTAISFLLLCISVIFARPERHLMATVTSHHVGGSLARRVLPLTLFLTFFTGWLLIAGARAGLYETEFALALFSTVIAFIFAAVVWANAGLLNKADLQRDQAELVLREAEAHKTAILESALDCIITADRSGRIIEFNPAAEKTFGHTREAAAGRELAEIIIPPALRERHRRGMSHYLATGEGPVLGKLVEFSGMRSDGSEFPIELAISAIQLNGEPLFTAYIRDITERKRAEEALRASEERYKLLFDENPHPMWVYDVETLTFLAVNASAISHYGYSEDEFLAMTMKDIRPQEDIPILMDAIGALTDQATARVVRRHRKKDGTLIEVEATSRGIVIGGRTARLVLTADVTERKGLEEQLRQSQKMEAVGRLAGGIAHDFNNLLTAIIGFADLLLQRTGNAALDQRAQTNVEQIRTAGSRAASLTRQLLAFSRKQMLQPRVLDLNEVVSHIEEMLHRLIGEDLELVTFTSPELGLVKADPGQIDQIIMNLAVNARDAMPNGGKLTIETANVELDEIYASTHTEVTAGEYVLLALSDTGHGMDSETASRVFEPFFTTKEPGKGTGLGLATVYGIVKQSGGHISVYSETGKGTTFKVYLPRIYEAAKTAQIEGHPAESLEGTETILLVEDDAGVRQLARTVLEAFGYLVLEASTGLEALEIARRYPDKIELLVTDVVMPRMGGKEMASRLLETRADIRVIYCSGYTENAVVHHGVIDDEVAFLQKPFSAEALARKVREVLDAPPYAPEKRDQEDD